MRARLAFLAVALLGLLLVSLVLATRAGAAGCSRQTVDVGIVKAIGCWTQSSNAGGTVYTAKFADQPEGIDMNGLVVTGPASGALQINSATRVVRSLTSAGDAAFAQLSSRNWPDPRKPFPIGLPTKLDFIAPQNSDLLLLNVNLPLVALSGGLVPVGSVASPVYLHSGGTGSIDLTVLLSGIFTLKGKPQSVTIDLPTTPEQGTKLDGFEVRLEEVDAIKAFALREFFAKYSASQNVVAGSATVSMPFMAPGKGFGAGFRLENGTLTEVSVSARGVKLPIGAPPAGVITDLGGGFRFVPVAGADFGPYCKSVGYEGARIVGPDRGPGAFGHWKCFRGSTNAGIDVGAACRLQSGNPSAFARYRDPNDAHSWECVGVSPTAGRFFDWSAFGIVGANFGPSVPTTCCGEIPPLRIDARLDLGSVAQAFFFKINGGVELFRIPVGDVFFAVHGDGGIEGSLGVGIGFPSFRNNENDPFYIGARVGGWMAKGRYQFEGRGRAALLGLKLFDAEVLMNNRASGACWTVLGFPGGAVYQYGSGGVRDFGVGCGLGDYKERFPAGSSATGARAPTFRLTASDGVLAVDGTGAAPRFTLRSADGRVLHTPRDGLSSLTRDYAFFVNDYTHTTHVVIRHPKGTWTVIPDSGSVITNLEAAAPVPKDHVTASVQGSGRTRTLIFHGLKRPHTQLLFTELLPDGSEIPLFQTSATSGRRHFTVAPGFGKRRVRVVVIEGFGSRQSAVVANYVVRHPPKSAAPTSVSAWDDEDTVHVQWSAVKGAAAYFVQVSTRGGRRQFTSYLRRISPRTRSIVIPHYPSGGGTTTANVYTLNGEGVLSNPRARAFPTAPSARTLAAAASRSARSAARRGDTIDVRTQCPHAEGDCQILIQLLHNSHAIASARYQQPPGTLHSVRVVPRRASDRRALRRGAKAFRLAIRIEHADELPVATAGVGI